MSSYVSAALRRAVIERANGVCEYCLLHESDGYRTFEVEHVIAEKHGGMTATDNLAYACLTCNRFKGSDIASLTKSTRALIRLFNPRIDRWLDHFAVNGAWISPLTDIGDVTVGVLGLNDEDRIAEREILVLARRWPPPESDHLITSV